MPVYLVRVKVRVKVRVRASQFTGRSGSLAGCCVWTQFPTVLTRVLADIFPTPLLFVHLPNPS